MEINKEKNKVKVEGAKEEYVEEYIYNLFCAGCESERICHKNCEMCETVENFWHEYYGDE